MPRFGFLAFALLLPIASPVFAQPIKRADLKPGLVLTIRDTGATPFTVSRIEPGVALALAAGESPHPRSTGGESFTWTGTINVFLPGKYKFDAVLIGRLSVKIGETEVYSATGTGDALADAKLIEGKEVELAGGIQPFRVEFTRTGPTARVELLWKGPFFQREPVPYFFFGHLPSQRPASLLADVAAEHGRFLFEELSCAKCHIPEATNAVAKTLVERTGPNLSEIGKRAYPGWLDAWLADPQKLRPHTMMPKMFTDDAAGKAERYAVVAYLASLGGPVVEPKQAPNPAEVKKSVANGARLYITAGCAACHGDKVNADPTKKKPRDDEEDEKPTAKPEDGFYTLGTANPTGYYRLGSVGSKFSATSLQRFLENPLATNPHGRMPNMVLSGEEARDIARFLVTEADPKLDRELPEAPATDKPRSLDEWKKLGKELVVSKGCVNCHSVAPGNKPLPLNTSFPKLGAIIEPHSSGCIGEKPALGKVPVYPLSADQRQALQAFLNTGFKGPGSATPGYQARAAIKRFNCLNCHNRDGEGGIDEALSDTMKALENAQNADDVQPPRLTGVGHKLRTPWFKQVLTQTGRARPWMTLRMPQYGEQNVGFLPHAIPALEGTVTDDTVKKPTFSAETVAAGRLLAGKSGLGCIACHDISGVQGGGTRGPDLATTNQRVRHDWYVRWMHQPQRIAPGTKMPQNFIDGKAQLGTVLGGNGDAQIEAMWAYFSLGPGLPLPVGIEPPGKALVVGPKERPELLRTFMPDGAGTKAIAVGYPGGMNLVFDAATNRLSYAWTGNFLDASPVWNNRGGAPAKLLGPKFWESPRGNPWAVSDSRTPPDFAKRANDPAYGSMLPNDELFNGTRLNHFAGFSLDANGNPAFRYSIDTPDGKPAIAVVEKPMPMPVTTAAGITRTFVVEVKGGATAWFHAADSSKAPRVYGPSGAKLPLDFKDSEVETPAVGSRVVAPQDGTKLTILEVQAAPPGTTWHFVPRNGGAWEVILRLPEATKNATTEIQLATWGLAQDDEALLKSLKPPTK